MKKLFCALFVLLVLSGTAKAEQYAIAAVVNDDIITTREVMGRYALAVHGANMQPDPETQKALRRQALDALIDEQIRLQEAKRLGIYPTDPEIDDAFGKLAAQNKMSPEQFKAILNQNPGVYDSLRRQLSTQIAWGNVVRKKIRPQINVAENDITAYIAEKEKNPAKVEFQVAEIFLKNNENNQKLATQLVNEMRAGKQRFSVLARQFSMGLEASKGGLLGWIPENRLEPVLDSAIKATPVGQISDPVVSPRGLHIFLVREKRDILPAKETSQRFTLKQIVAPLAPTAAPAEVEKAAQGLRDYQTRLADCAAMDALIKQPNSPARDMGQVRLADLPPPVVSAIKDLPVGKLSEPVRAADGFVALMACDRETNSEDALREDVANTIGTERLNRLQYRYYRDLRAASYVDIKQQ